MRVSRRVRVRLFARDFLYDDPRPAVMLIDYRVAGVRVLKLGIDLAHGEISTTLATEVGAGMIRRERARRARAAALR